MGQLDRVLECHECDPSELRHAPEFLQSDIWAKQKARFGWEAKSFIVRSAHGGVSLHLLVLLRTIATMRIAYIPHAPSTDFVREMGRQFSPAELLEAIGAALRPHLPAAFLIRFDLNWNPKRLDQPQVQAGLEASSLRKAIANIQPPDTVILRISAEERAEADILAQMKSKTRYNIRLAAKKGVQTECIHRQDFEIPTHFDDWYDIYQITEKRNRIALHSRNYYANLFSITRAEQCRLYLAYHEKDLLAGIIVVQYRGLGRYLYGASSNYKRSLMPAYALQWRAICDLRQSGASYYDFFGIPPVASGKHPMAGLYRFKTGFGGEIIHSPGAWDMPLKGFYYFAYRMLEALRMYYYRVLKKGGASQ